MSCRPGPGVILYLSGLNMIEGKLNKEQLAKLPSKTKKPSYRLWEETLPGSYQQDLESTIHYNNVAQILEIVFGSEDI